MKAYIKLLNDMNWETWSFLMEQFLTIHDLWDIVNRVETKPTEASQKADFCSRQKSTCAQIALCVSGSQLNTVRLETDPKKIWDELQHINRPGGFGTHMALHQELVRMKKDPQVPMSKWIASVHDVAQQIKDVGSNVLDKEVIIVLTNSLPDSYTPLVVQLDTLEDSAQTVSHVITCLIGEECCQLGGHQHGQPGETDWESMALAVVRKCRDCSKITCFRCGEKGHFCSECPKGKDGDHKPPKPPTGTLY